MRQSLEKVGDKAMNLVKIEKQGDREMKEEKGRSILGKGEENMNGCGDDTHNRWTRQGIMGSG